MKRMLTLSIALSLVLGLSASSAADSSRREIEIPYRTPVLGASTSVTDAYYYDCLKGIGCAFVQVKNDDRDVMLEVKDASGLPVHASVYKFRSGKHYRDFCGSTKKPLVVTPGMNLVVHVKPGTCADGTTVSTPTTGVVKAVFTTKKRWY